MSKFAKLYACVMKRDVKGYRFEVNNTEKHQSTVWVRKTTFAPIYFSTNVLQLQMQTEEQDSFLALAQQ